MSKIIVDQVQKNGGTALTLPASDASTANQPLVSNASGTLAFSPISLPASDPGANKFLTSDGSNQLQASSFSVPASAGTNGQVLTSNGAGAATWAGVSAGGWDGAYVVNCSTANSSTITVNWTDVVSGITDSEIAQVQISLLGVSASGSGRFRFYGRNGSGNISSGYLGYTTNYNYWGSDSDNQGDNSNQGWWQIPNYTNMASTGYSYGSGLTGTLDWYIFKDDSYGNYMVHGTYAYQQNTSYNAPNGERTQWDNYSTSTPPVTASHGYQMQATSGNINRGFLITRIKKRT